MKMRAAPEGTARSCSQSSRLEGNPRVELDFSSRQRRGCLSKCRIRQVPIHRAQVCSVEQVEEIETQLEIAPLTQQRDVRVLDYARIQLEEAGVAVNVARKVPFCSGRR